MVCFTILSVAAFAAMFFRAFFSIITTDEVFNIAQAYRTVLGQKFMVENWDFFQVGDSLNYPFIWLYYKITGSSEGLVLYMRLCFVLITLIFAFLSYRLLKPIYGKASAFASILIYFTMVTKTVFGLWYDTWSLSFMLLGYLLILYALQSKNSLPWLLLSGVCQAIAVYAYPTAVVVFIYEVVALFVVANKNKKKFNMRKPEIIYIVGAAVVFAIFVVFCLMRDWQSFFIFNKTVTTENLSDRSSSIVTLISSARVIALDFIFYYKYLLLSSLVFGVLCFLLRKDKIPKIILPLYLFVSTILLFYVFDIGLIGTNAQNQLYILFYWNICALFMHIVFYREDAKFKNCFIFLYVPSLLAGIVWAFTGMDKSLNIPLGSRTGAILFLVELFDIISQIELKKLRNPTVPAMCCFLVLNIFILYSGQFQSMAPIEIFTESITVDRAEYGIYKNLYSNKETVDYVERFEKNLNAIVEPDDKTILCGRKIIFGYLMTDLKPNTNYLWVPGALTGSITDDNHYDLLFNYFDSYYGNPDIIVLRTDEDEYKNKAFMDFVDSNYEKKIVDSEYAFYHLK